MGNHKKQGIKSPYDNNVKKNPKAFYELRDEYYKVTEEKGLSKKLCEYVFDVLVSMSRGYGFNSSHTLGYSIVALQEANLAYYYPIVYWNCANLISDSGGEDSTVKYDKIASAIGRVISEGAKVSLPAINKARFDFKPDPENNEIIYGLKPISGIGAQQANAIVGHQPYASMWDFYEKMQTFKSESQENKFGDSAMITLIKAGCFDELENKPREEIMADFIRKISKPVSSLRLTDIPTLNDLGLLSKAQQAKELRYYRYRDYVFKPANFVKQTGKSGSTAYYKLDHKFAEPFFYEHFEDKMKEGKDYEWIDGYICVKKGSFERVFDTLMSDFKDTVLNNKDNIKAINDRRFNDIWTDKCSGSISRWEMEALSYYYHEHELAHVDINEYQIVNFSSLPEEPEMVYNYGHGKKIIPRFRLVRIVGTVIGKDKNHNTVTLLTPNGVVTTRLYKGQFGFYDREIAKINEDGTKTKLESSWFKRGTMLMITGYRKEEQFIAKKYKDSIYKHSIQRIEKINDDGTLILKSERTGMEDEEENFNVQL